MHAFESIRVTPSPYLPCGVAYVRLFLSVQGILLLPADRQTPPDLSQKTQKLFRKALIFQIPFPFPNSPLIKVPSVVPASVSSPP